MQPSVPDKTKPTTISFRFLGEAACDVSMLQAENEDCFEVPKAMFNAGQEEGKPQEGKRLKRQKEQARITSQQDNSLSRDNVLDRSQTQPESSLRELILRLRAEHAKRNEESSQGENISRFKQALSIKMTEKYFLSREAQFSRKLDRCIYNFAHQEGFRSEEIYNIVQGGRQSIPFQELVQMEYPKKLAYLTSLLTASKDDSVGDLIHLVLAERDRIKNVLKEKLCDISKYVQLQQQIKKSTWQ